MKLVEQINQRLKQHPLQVVSPGQAVKAMIPNGLGFVSAPLYLFEQFFVGKATEHLLGEGIRAEHLNDDRMVRVLDELYEVRLRKLSLSEIAKILVVSSKKLLLKSGRSILQEST